jgi:hypothetical protein
MTDSSNTIFFRSSKSILEDQEKKYLIDLSESKPSPVLDAGGEGATLYEIANRFYRLTRKSNVPIFSLQEASPHQLKNLMKSSLIQKAFLIWFI